MWGALFRLSKDGRGDKKITSREYENIRSKFSRLQSEKKKGYKPWNTGRTNVYSDEQLRRMSEARKKATTSETIRKIKEARAKQDMSWRRGMKFSEETKRKLSISHMNHKLTDEQKQKIGKANKKLLPIKREKYRVYKENGGSLMWNDFQKALKKGEI